MKKITLITITLLFFFNLSVNAQGRLKVRQDQYIQIGYETPTNTSLTFGKCAGSSNCSTYNNGEYAIEVWNNGLNFWKPWPSYYSGNYKLVLSKFGQVGVGMSPYFIPGFNLQVNGGMIASAYATVSDKRLKENIKPVEGALNKILKFKAVTYNYKSNIDLGNSTYEDGDIDEIKKKTIENQEKGLNSTFAKKIRIGYLAQEVEEIMPELVITNDESGYKALNYMEMIPLAIEAIKEQQKMIDKLSAELENIKALNQLIKLPKDVGVKATLFQNNPNPFDQSTSISFNIESDFETAQLVVSDFFGESKATHTITNQGEGKYTLQAGSLQSGTYYYSLIINNVIVDTRIMFLVK